MPSMLEIHALHAYYGDSHALRGVDLRIDAGQAMGLLGRNGMGKSTLIRTVLGLVPAASGRVLWRGHDVTGSVPERMARLGIAYVPEGRGIFPNLSVRENLTMCARPGSGGGWNLERVLALFPRLAERLGHGGQQLSGGEQQMLAIGRALLTNPTLLILDEATEGLAPKLAAEIWHVIGQVNASGMATLTVDRNYRAVLAHSDRAVVMEKGHIVHAADAAELATQPATLTRLLGV